MCKKQQDLQLSMKFTRVFFFVFYLTPPNEENQDPPQNHLEMARNCLQPLLDTRELSIRYNTIINYHGTIIMVQSCGHLAGTIESVRSKRILCGEDVRPFFPLGQSKLSVIKNCVVCLYTPLVSRSGYKQFQAVSRWFWRGLCFLHLAGL